MVTDMYTNTSDMYPYCIYCEIVEKSTRIYQEYVPMWCVCLSTFTINKYLYETTSDDVGGSDGDYIRYR